MNKKARRVEIAEGYDLVKLAEEVRISGEPVLLTKSGESLAMLAPVPRRSQSSARGTPLTEDDPLFGLIGIGRSGTTGGLSEKKHSVVHYQSATDISGAG